ncbi:hypothetical protein NsoK4_04250 [Nitrosopumilus sp. K4]|uniref:hypothetical protein n=1 Tax=Nitrosopumilus sp. K4 TaxID=2795383 RepID=UPI001BAB1BED|nr:hypothetical protein [Nitrosopumilus sp. K4]QUC65463.1 hypothetical protein NsoK4_04250 [Nitrosopumilus sp. K4]
MQFLKSLHDPTHEKYASYYAIVLAVIVSFVIFMSVNMIEISVIEATAVFFEGFASMYMLSRHRKTQNDFATHLSKLSINRLSVS